MQRSWQPWAHAYHTLQDLNGLQNCSPADDRIGRRNGGDDVAGDGLDIEFTGHAKHNAVGQCSLVPPRRGSIGLVVSAGGSLPKPGCPSKDKEFDPQPPLPRQ